MSKVQSDEKVIRVTLVRSPIGYTKDQRATARALGLRRLHQTMEHKDTPTVRGMIQKIIHLVRVDN